MSRRRRSKNSYALRTVTDTIFIPGFPTHRGSKLLVLSCGHKRFFRNTWKVPATSHCYVCSKLPGFVDPQQLNFNFVEEFDQHERGGSNG